MLGLGYFPPPEPPTHRWQGDSREWYYFTIYPIEAVPNFIRACNYIFARPKFDGTREPFYIGESGHFCAELANHPKIEPARRLGATEVHIHFSARSRSQRLDIETDLRRGHWTPLNYQQTPALPFSQGIGGLAALGIGSGLAGFPAGPSPPPPPRNALLDLLRPTGFDYPMDLDWLLRRG